MKISRSLRLTRSLVLIQVALVILPCAVWAGSATWNLNPTNDDWNTAANWTPATVPSVAGDVASFAVSNTTAVMASGGRTLDAIVFEAGASAFTITVPNASAILLLGTGIVNDSGLTQNIVLSTDFVSSALTLNNGATVGSGVQITAETPRTNQALGASVLFANDSGMPAASAGSGVYIAEGAKIKNQFGGSVVFRGSSTADQATITLEAAVLSHGTLNSFGGFAQFWDSTTAANSTITCNGGIKATQQGGTLTFLDSSTAGNATLIAQAGTHDLGGPSMITFTSSSLGGTARIEVFGNSILDITTHNRPGSLSIGSLEGSGIASLGPRALTVGTNNLNTTFSGTITGTRGALTKSGAGTFTLSGGASSYTGGTTVVQGTLVVSNKTGSATGTGPVTVMEGTLGGSGIIAGAVTIGPGTGNGAFLAPAHKTKRPQTLATLSILTFQNAATYTYTYTFDGNTLQSDEVVANGTTINTGTNFSITATPSTVLPVGTVLTVISNTSASPISGAFGNLPDGAILTVNGNNFQASYEGGDGNDLTLTVVP
jgi:autotransporter-associated beta strand protein